MEKLLIGILTYNRLEFTKKCIDSLYKNTDADDFDLVILDNGSTDGTKEYLATLYKDCHEFGSKNMKTILLEENSGVAGGLNHILKTRKTNQHFMKLDNDIVFKDGSDKDWVKKISDILNSDVELPTAKGGKKVGAICVKPYTWIESEKKEVNLIPEHPEVKLGNWIFQYNPEGVLGCSTVFRKEVFDFFKKFDEGMGLYGYEESLMMIQMMRNGYVSFFSKEIARVYHIDPGGDTDYIHWKHKLAKDNFPLYMKKFKELLR